MSIISFTSAELRRFIQTSTIGASTFVLDMALLYGAVEYIGIDYRIATAGAFLVCVTLNYILARKYIFSATTRTHTSAYALYIATALTSMLAITGSVWLLVDYMLLPYMYARVLVACVVGVINYIVSVALIFKVPAEG